MRVNLFFQRHSVLFNRPSSSLSSRQFFFRTHTNQVTSPQQASNLYRNFATQRQKRAVAAKSGISTEEKGKKEKNKIETNAIDTDKHTHTHTRQRKTNTNAKIPSMSMYMDPKEEFSFPTGSPFESSKSSILSVNNEDLYDEEIHLPDKPDFTDKSLNYEESTPLSDQMIKLIGLRGPITTADFMAMALTDPENGYYTSKVLSPTDDDLFQDDDLSDNDASSSTSAIIGKQGDFTTAPEISQLFGECMLLFYIYQYRNSLQSPKAIQLVEIGPGKGTLMADILSNACSSFPDFANALAEGGGVHLVEVSPDMRNKQRDLLMKQNPKLNELGFQVLFDSEDSQDMKSKQSKHTKVSKNVETEYKSIRIHWHDALAFVPPTDVHGKNIPHFILCQEFVDALPIHSFQKHSDGSWRERMVDVDILPNSDSVGDSSTLEDANLMLEAMPDQPKKPRLRFVLSKANTPALDSLLKLPPDQEEKAQVGDIIEICPRGLMLIQDISTRISQCKGASLIIDYGTTYGNGDTLRGFYKHKQVHPLTMPGKVDVTADVTFGALKQEVDKMKGVACHGPTTQGEFLNSMGAVERVVALIDKDETTDEQAEELFLGLQRLVSPEEMGERFKVLGVVSGDNEGAPGFSR